MPDTSQPATFKFRIYSHSSDRVIYEAELDASLAHEPRDIQLGAAVRLAVYARANLSGANLRDANLTGAYLRDANLRDAILTGAYLRDAYLRDANLRDANLSDANLRDANLLDADLRGANLIGANLRGANLSDANLIGAYLRDANLRGADLYGANLRGASLRGANLIGANLRGANLRDANLSGANLSDANLLDADLRGANLCGTNLRDAQDAELAMAMTVVIPPEGEVIGWKKCRGPDYEDVLVKVRVPPEARRSNAGGRKCRAEFVDVLEVIGGTYGISKFDGTTEYRVGQRVTCDHWDDDRWNECGGGIHLFITRAEAEAY